MALTDETSTLVEGKWTVTWRPTAALPMQGVLTFARSGDAVTVLLETDEESTEASATVRGNRLSWTMKLLGTTQQCEVVVEGDELSGRAMTVGGRIGAGSSIEGTRVGSNVRIRTREGSEAVVDTLIACGVEYVFGYSGGPNSSLTRSVARIPNIPGRNELSAAWMSYGYNQSKNRAASAAVLYAVGVMHASPVIHAAKVDSTPLLALFVESSAAWDARDILQDGTDLYPALRPFSKYIKRVVDGEDLPLMVRQAVTAASTGKFGAAVLDLTHLAMLERTSIKTEALVLPFPPAASEQAVLQAAEMIRKAQRPVVLAGAGIHHAGARTELRRFAEATGIPVVNGGPSGRGVLPDDHPLYGGAMTSWGAFPTGAKVAQEADLWIAVGFSFSQTSTSSWSIPKPDRVIHVDIEETQIGRIFEPTLGIVADAKAFLAQLTDHLAASGVKVPDYAESPRIREIADAKKHYFELLASTGGDGSITKEAIGQVLTEQVPAETILVGDEGFMVTGMVYKSSKYPNGFAPPMGFHYASLGSTLPVAIGAKLANPDKLVISVGGDAGFYYDCADLSILAEHNLKIVVIVYNNGGLYGGPKGRIGIRGPWLDLPDTDYAMVARGFGVPAERVEHPSELEPAIGRALAADGPYFLEIRGNSGFSTLVLDARHAPSPPPKFGHGDKHVHGSWPN